MCCVNSVLWSFDGVFPFLSRISKCCWSLTFRVVYYRPRRQCGRLSHPTRRDRAGENPAQRRGRLECQFSCPPRTVVSKSDMVTTLPNHTARLMTTDSLRDYTGTSTTIRLTASEDIMKKYSLTLDNEELDPYLIFYLQNSRYMLANRSSKSMILLPKNILFFRSRVYSSTI